MASRLQPLWTLPRLVRPLPFLHRPFTGSARLDAAAAAAAASPTVPPKQSKPDPTVPTPVSEEVAAAGGSTDPTPQAPNRADVWAPSQQPRAYAMMGPRFEQTEFWSQPQPWSAMELVHQQPVRWTHDRVVACDGGGGANGHPRIFVNTDKPEISVCNYCGLPYANEHHREHLEALPKTSYPLRRTTAERRGMDEMRDTSDHVAEG